MKCEYLLMWAAPEDPKAKLLELHAVTEQDATEQTEIFLKAMHANRKLDGNLLPVKASLYQQIREW